MDDAADTGTSDQPATKLFGDSQSKFVERGPERRTPEMATADSVGPTSGRETTTAGTRNELASTALAVLGLLVFGGGIIAGGLILYNAKSVGAFRNPSESTRVAIGIAVLALSVVQSATLLGIAKVLSRLEAERRRPT